MQQLLVSVQPSTGPQTAIYFLEPNELWAFLTKWLNVWSGVKIRKKIRMSFLAALIAPLILGR